MATTLDHMTAEDYFKLSDGRQPTELVRGKVVELNLPAPKHGKICLLVGRLLGNFVADHDLGTVVGNDAGVITARNPDTVRGPDVSYFSYARLPKGPLPDGYLSVVPEMVVEVLSLADRWSDVHEKIGEYLGAGVLIVCIVDPKTQSVHVYYADQPPRTLTKNEDWTVPEVLPDFRIPIAKLFE